MEISFKIVDFRNFRSYFTQKLWAMKSYFHSRESNQVNGLKV